MNEKQTNATLGEHAGVLYEMLFGENGFTAVAPMKKDIGSIGPFPKKEVATEAICSLIDAYNVYLDKCPGKYAGFKASQEYKNVFEKYKLSIPDHPAQDTSILNSDSMG